MRRPDPMLVDDLPYGPGNSDYEYDGRDDEAEAAHHEQQLQELRDQENQDDHANRNV